MPTSSLPIWLTTLQVVSQIALGLGTMVLAFLALRITKAQKEIAANKLKLDLFDRRIASFQRIQATPVYIVQHASLSPAQFCQYMIDIQDSRWLFGNDLFKIFNGEFKNLILELMKLNGKNGSALSQTELQRESELLQLILKYFDSNLIPLFERYLRIEHK